MGFPKASSHCQRGSSLVCSVIREASLAMTVVYSALLEHWHFSHRFLTNVIDRSCRFYPSRQFLPITNNLFIFPEHHQYTIISVREKTPPSHPVHQNLAIFEGTHFPNAQRFFPMARPGSMLQQVSRA